MSTYPLKALSKDRKELVVFGIEDGPCPLDSNFFVLTKRPGSPILRYDSILRGMDVPNLFEGDIIESNGTQYIIKYHRGFNAISLEGDTLEIKDLRRAKVVDQLYFQDNFKKKYPTRHKYIIDGVDTEFTRFMGATETGVIINDSNLPVVPFFKVMQNTGMRYKGNKLYFGNIINNCPVVLYKGNIVIIENGKPKLVKDLK